MIPRAPAAFRALENRFKVVHTDRTLAPTGEPHIQLSGTVFGCIADIEDAAVAKAEEYATGKHGTLYWRIVPEYRQEGNGSRGSFYMRLLISNKEPIE